MSETLNKTLILAAEGGDLATVQEMLARGANPNAMGPESAALHCAAFEGHLEVVTALLAHAADPNLADTRGFFALQLAASKGRDAVAQALIAAGAQLEATTQHGGTALHVAAASNFPSMVKLLMEAGANLEARDAGGNTPLATACGLGCKEIFHLLKEAGANMQTLSDGKETLLIKVARGIRRLRLKSWLSQGEIEGEPVSYQIKVGSMKFTRAGKSTTLDRATQREIAELDWGPKAHLPYLDAIDIAYELLELGFEAHAQDADGHTAFSLICHAGIGELIEAMAKQMQLAHADFAIAHAHGFQPLHLVAGSQRLDGLEAFLRHVRTIDATVTDMYGWTPLHWLADMGGDVKMAELLIAAGGDVHAQSTQKRGENMEAGITPAEVAAYWGDADMAEALKTN